MVTTMASDVEIMDGDVGVYSLQGQISPPVEEQALQIHDFTSPSSPGNGMEATPLASDVEFPPLQGHVSSPVEKGAFRNPSFPSPPSPSSCMEQGCACSWASLVNGGHSAGSLTEHPLEVELQDGRLKILIPQEAYEEMNRPFQWAALARLQDSSPNGRTNFSFVFLKLTRLWAGKANPKFTILTGGTFLVRVEDEQQLQCILQKQAWRVGTRPLVTHRWKPGQPLTMLPELSGPLWIRLSNLPPNMWTMQIFRSIAKGLQGEFLEMDTQTRDINRGGFARIRVELPFSAPLLPELQFVLQDSHILTQSLIYEGRLRTYPHEESKGKDSLKAPSSSKGLTVRGQKGISNSKNQFTVLMELDDTNEVPTKSSFTTKVVSSPQDHTSRGSMQPSSQTPRHDTTTRRAKGKGIMREVTENQTSMGNPFHQTECMPSGIPPGFSFTSSPKHNPQVVAKTPYVGQEDVHNNDLKAAGKRKRVSLCRVEDSSETGPPPQTNDASTSGGEGIPSNKVIDSDLPILHNFKEFLSRVGMERPNVHLQKDLLLWQDTPASNIKTTDVWEVVCVDGFYAIVRDTGEDRRDLQVWLNTGIVPDKCPRIVTGQACL
ncbi:hypothetical protein EJ110_NYTH16845 [Nymphaea thermarum]|nr:hypothetical protein EJ110_NYTH16845 [Nymphaea thermarum]